MPELLIGGVFIEEVADLVGFEELHVDGGKVKIHFVEEFEVVGLHSTTWEGLFEGEQVYLIFPSVFGEETLTVLVQILIEVVDAEDGGLGFEGLVEDDEVCFGYL